MRQQNSTGEIHGSACTSCTSTLLGVPRHWGLIARLCVTGRATSLQIAHQYRKTGNLHMECAAAGCRLPVHNMAVIFTTTGAITLNSGCRNCSLPGTVTTSDAPRVTFLFPPRNRNVTASPPNVASVLIPEQKRHYNPATCRIRSRAGTDTTVSPQHRFAIPQSCGVHADFPRSDAHGTGPPRPADQ